jgi:hypothetical protein
MSACARRRWGEGTPCARPAAETPAKKEMDAKLAAMLAARERQDARLWGNQAQPAALAATPGAAPATLIKGGRG